VKSIRETLVFGKRDFSVGLPHSHAPFWIYGALFGSVFILGMTVFFMRFVEVPTTVHFDGVAGQESHAICRVVLDRKLPVGIVEGATAYWRNAEGLQVPWSVGKVLGVAEEVEGKAWVILGEMPEKEGKGMIKEKNFFAIQVVVETGREPIWKLIW